MNLPFTEKAKLSPSNENLIRTLDTTSIYNTILCDLSESFGFAKLKHNKTTKVVMRILYNTNPISRKTQFLNIKLRISIEDYWAINLR